MDGIKLRGSLKSLTFINPDNGYSIARYITDESDSGKQSEFIAVGTLPGAREGGHYEFTGNWKVHPKYGDQFGFYSFVELEPESDDEIEAFLSSGAIKGIGPKTAKLIVDRFGDETLDILEDSPNRLLSIEGIGPKKLETITSSFAKHKDFAEVVLFFRQYEISAEAAMSLYKEYGAGTIESVKENPYRIVDDIHGVGFKTADGIAMKMGEEKNSGNRIKSGILYILSRYSGEGNTCIPAEELRENAVELLDVTRDEIDGALFIMQLEGSVDEATVEHEKRIFLNHFFSAERGITKSLLRLMSQKPSSIMADIDDLISRSEIALGLDLSQTQRMAIAQAIDNGIFIITGGPGTGKTTIIKAILDIFSHQEMDVSVAAPTGRAAKRITETTGSDASTIHRLLEYSCDEGTDRWYFGRNAEMQLEADVVIVDEASMIDVILMNALLEAIPTGTRLIMVGDADQLPSVGAGNVLRDMLISERVENTCLSEIFRQAGGSKIVLGAHSINHGEYPDLNSEGSDFFMLQRQGEAAIFETLMNLIVNRLPNYEDGFDPVNDIQVLTPIKRGLLGNINLNVALQRELNPQDGLKAEKQYGSRLFREGDRVMQIKNNYGLYWSDESGKNQGEGIFNGDMGLIRKIDNESGQITVVYDGSRLCEYDFTMLDELEHAYAITVHKSQGNEFPAVVMPVFPTAPALSARNVLYTAVTRGSRLVVLVGSEHRVKAMIDNNSSRKRYSALFSFIKEYCDFE